MPEYGKMEPMATILIAAGGTAGHVVPALAVADELRASGAEPVFVGTRERIEAQLVPAAGYRIEFLSVSGIDRRNPVNAAKAIAKAGLAVPAAARLLGQLRPAAIFGGGGYIAGPVGLAARTRRIPLVLSEADSHLGLTNRILAPFAKRVCLAFPIADHVGKRYIVTGRPVPRAVIDADPVVARRRLAIDESARCLFVFGGSQGARSINECAFEAFAHDVPDGVVILHISGSRDHPALAAQLAQLGDPPGYRLFDYLGTLADPLAACDVVLGRSGGSLFEIAAAGKPALLVPYPHAAAGHQDENARWMAEAGAAVVLPDEQLAPMALREQLLELLEDGQRLDAMAQASRTLAKPDAAKRIAAEILSAAEEM